MKNTDLIQLERAVWKRTGGQGDHVKSTRPGHVVVAHPHTDTAPATLGNGYRRAGWDGG